MRKSVRSNSKLGQENLELLRINQQPQENQEKFKKIKTSFIQQSELAASESINLQNIHRLKDTRQSVVER